MQNKKSIALENTIVVILGQTASGKTEISLRIAAKNELEIISADSRQIYKYLNIGTAKPSIEELKFVKHHFIDYINPDELYSAGKFGDDAEKICFDIFNRNKLPLIVGGSGLYIKALCEGLFQEEIKPDTDLRDKMNQRFVETGIDELYEELLKYDKKSALQYTDKNPRRILRALEYYYSTGTPLSQAHLLNQKKRSYNVIYFGIEIDRQILYDKINKRVEQMWNNGLVEETQKVLDIGYPPSLNSLNTVGYKECIDFLNNKITKPKAIELIKQNTRHYAKRQMTWFSKNNRIVWISGNSKEIADKILSYIKKFK